jgi:hypothetical protein
MGMNLSDNYLIVEILTHADITFFTQNKPMNNHTKFGKRFVGHLYIIFMHMYEGIYCQHI